MGGVRAIAGKRALITGGSRGIGLAVARALAAAGARVVLVARDAARLEKVAEGLGAQWHALDVTDEQAVQGLVQVVGGGRDGTPDIIVNSAGAFALAPIAETTIESFDRHIAVNLRAVFLVVRGFLPGQLQRGSGDIVTIGSIAGRVAFPANGAYSASKFGVRGLHAVLSAELKGTGVRATLIEPAATDTDLWDRIDRNRFPELPETSLMLRPEAVAQAVLYAVSQPADVVVPNLLVERG